MAERPFLDFLAPLEDALAQAEALAMALNGANLSEHQLNALEFKRPHRQSAPYARPGIPRNGWGRAMSAPDVLSLSCVADKDCRRRFWSVKPTGDYGEDCQTGYRLALGWLSYEESIPDGCGILGMIVRDMPEKLSGVEIGFFAIVGIAARSGAKEARRVADYWREVKP